MWKGDEMWKGEEREGRGGEGGKWSLVNTCMERFLPDLRKVTCMVRILPCLRNSTIVPNISVMRKAVGNIPYNTL